MKTLLIKKIQYMKFLFILSMLCNSNNQNNNINITTNNVLENYIYIPIDITPEDFLENYAIGIILNFRKAIDVVPIKGRYLKLENLEIIKERFTNRTYYYQHMTESTKFLHESLDSLFKHDFIISPHLREVFTEHIENYIVTPLYKLNKKQNKAEYKKLSKQSGPQIEQYIKEVGDSLIADLEVFLKECTPISWEEYIQGSLDKAVNKLESAATSESKLKNGDAYEKILTANTKISSDGLYSLKYAIASITNFEISEFLTQNISADSSYLEAMKQVRDNFGHFKTSQHMSTIERLLSDKFNRVDIYEIIVSDAFPFLK